MKKFILVLLFITLGVALYANAAPLRVGSTTSLTSSSPELVYVTAGGSVDINLPACSSGVNDGLSFIIRGTYLSSTAFMVVPASGDTIEGSSGFGMNGYQANKFSCDGENDNWVGLSYW